MSDIVVELVKGGWPIVGFAAALFVVSLLVFGLFPGPINRRFARCFPKNDPRREEMIAELYAVRIVERPWWVVQQAERAIYEGIKARRLETRPATPIMIEIFARSVGQVGIRRVKNNTVIFRLPRSHFLNFTDRSYLRIIRKACDLYMTGILPRACVVVVNRALHGDDRLYEIRRGRRWVEVVIEPSYLGSSPRYPLCHPEELCGNCV